MNCIKIVNTKSRAICRLLKYHVAMTSRCKCQCFVYNIYLGNMFWIAFGLPPMSYIGNTEPYSWCCNYYFHLTKLLQFTGNDSKKKMKIRILINVVQGHTIFYFSSRKIFFKRLINTTWSYLPRGLQCRTKDDVHTPKPVHTKQLTKGVEKKQIWKSTRGFW